MPDWRFWAKSEKKQSLAPPLQAGFQWNGGARDCCSPLLRFFQHAQKPFLVGIACNIHRDSVNPVGC